MFVRSRRLLPFFSTALTRYLTPFAPNLQPAAQLPTLKLKSQKLILHNWWAEHPFETQTDLRVPVFSFEANQFLGQSVDLPAEIFNQPLRRDLVFKLYQYRINLNRFRTHMTRNRAMTSGSGKKMRPQKKTGSARQGDKRAPHLRKGGKAHGAKPKVYSTHLNAKVKLKALCSLLTGKLVEGKIKIIDTEKIAEPKTKIVNGIITKHVADDRALFCIITSSKVNQNFSLAHRNIDRVLVHDSYNLDVKSLFIADKIFITLDGLQELVDNINKTKYVAYRQPYMPKVEDMEPKPQEEVVRWDPEKPYEFKFKILAQYLDLYEKVKAETPELLQAQLKKIRKIEHLN